MDFQLKNKFSKYFNLKVQTMKGERLFDLFEVVSNKTVRKNEKLFKRYAGHKDVPGKMIKTKRGFFLSVLHKNVDNSTYFTYHELDKKSVDLWFNMVKEARVKTS